MKYILPEEKFRFLRMIAVIFYLLNDDMAKKATHNLNGNVLKLIKKLPIIPLYGDIHIDLHTIAKDRTYVSNLYNELDPTVVENDFLNSLSIERQKHITSAIRFKTIMLQIGQKNQREIPMKQCKTVVSIVRELFELLSNWTQTILLHYSYKLSKPKEKEVKNEDDKKKRNTIHIKINPTPEETIDDTSPTIEYQRRIKFNYSSQEKKKISSRIFILYKKYRRNVTTRRK